MMYLYKFFYFYIAVLCIDHDVVSIVSNEVEPERTKYVKLTINCEKEIIGKNKSCLSLLLSVFNL